MRRLVVVLCLGVDDLPGADLKADSGMQDVFELVVVHKQSCLGCAHRFTCLTFHHDHVLMFHAGDFHCWVTDN